MGRTLKELRRMTEDVQDEVGYALDLVQRGMHPPAATPMKGNLRDVMEILVSEDGDTYRTMYTVKLESLVYVLDVFKKKSKSGIATPKADLDRILSRLQAARQHYKSLDKDD